MNRKTSINQSPKSDMLAIFSILALSFLLCSFLSATFLQYPPYWLLFPFHLDVFGFSNIHALPQYFPFPPHLSLNLCNTQHIRYCSFSISCFLLFFVSSPLSFFRLITNWLMSFFRLIISRVVLCLIYTFLQYCPFCLLLSPHHFCCFRNFIGFSNFLHIGCCSFCTQSFSSDSLVSSYISSITSILVLSCSLSTNLYRLLFRFFLRFSLPKISVLLAFIPSSDNRFFSFARLYDSSWFSIFVVFLLFFFSLIFIFFLRIFLQYLYLSFFLHDSYFFLFLPSFSYIHPIVPLSHISSLLLCLSSYKFVLIISPPQARQLNH